MDINKFIKVLDLPAGFVAPTTLEHEELIASPLTRNHVKDDLAAVKSNASLIRQKRGGSWPPEDLDEEADFLDLAWHEREFKCGGSFAYVVYDIVRGNFVGCFYLYPMGKRSQLSLELAQYDVDVSWWVAADSYKRGRYGLLYNALLIWLRDYFPFQKPFFSNEVIPGTKIPLGNKSRFSLLFGEPNKSENLDGYAK